MSLQRRNPARCPECEATQPAPAAWPAPPTQPAETTKCWLCGARLEPGQKAAAQPQAPSADLGAYAVEAPPLAASPPPAAPERRVAFQFSLATLMLTVTVVAVLLGVFVMSPGWGIVLAILMTPAWLRTCVVVSGREARGRPMSAHQKLELFAASVGVVLNAGMAAIGAFFAIWLTGVFIGWVSSIGGQGYEGLQRGVHAGWVLGIIVGACVLFWGLRRLWARKD
jgi:hypothetical protein